MAPGVGADYHPLFAKFNSEDPDIRYMTLVDLGRLLETTSQATLGRETTVCVQIVDNLIKRLDDTNGDVQNQALKCIQPFTVKAPADHLIPFMQKVVNLKIDKSQDASIVSTAARTLVLSLAHPVPGAQLSGPVIEAFTAISRVLIPKLTGEVNPDDASKGFIDFSSPKGVSIEALDLLAEVVRCYGILLEASQVEALEECLIRVLNDDRTGSIAKKKTISALARLSIWFSNDQFSAFVSRTVEDFRASHLTVQKRRLLISSLGAIARSTPTKFGPYLQTIAPFVFSALSQEELEDTRDAIAEDNYDPATDDLKEAALLTVEEFLLCCASDMHPFTNDVVESGLRYLTYNPTMVGGSDDEMADNDDDDQDDLLDDDDDYEQEEQFDDDDDASWKIRRSAGKVFNALISTRTDLLEGGSLYNQILPALTRAYKDREDSVQLEAVQATTLIFMKTADTVSTPIISTDDIAGHDLSPSGSRKRRRTDSNMGALSAEELSRGYASPAQRQSSPASGSRKDLLQQAPAVLSGAITVLSGKSAPNRQAAISLIKAFVHLKHDSLSGQLENVLNPVIEIIQPTSGNTSSQSAVTVSAGGGLRIGALQLLGVVFDTHSSILISPFVEKAIEAISAAVNDANFKIASEALETGESIIKALTPPRAFGYDKQSQKYIEAMFEIVLHQTGSSEADLEVRQRAIQALGVCVARTGLVSGLSSSANRLKALSLLRERLSGETTRLSSTLAIDLILSTDQSGHLDSQWTNAVAMELGSQLRKADRRVRSTSLTAIKKLTGNIDARKSLDQKALQEVVGVVLQLYNSEGLTHIVLITEILSDLVEASPQTVVTDDCNKALCSMAVQNLGGHTLDSFLELISNIGAAGVGAPLMNGLLQDVGVQGDPQVVGTTIGTLIASGGATVPIKIDSLIQEVKTKADDRRVALALIILGEVGAILGAESEITPEIFADGLTSKSELVQAAAATSLGRAAATNTNLFVPVLFETFQSQSANRNLSLMSVKELLQQISRSNSDISAYTQQLWESLLKLAPVDETRPLVAECMGRLVAIEPAKYFPLLEDHLSNTKPGVRGTVIQAVRFAVSDSDESSDEALRPYLVKMLVVMLQDNNVENKRLAMATLHSAARNKPRLVLGSLSQLLPYVIKASELDTTLIREVQMGPFKHKVDDGLEKRKGAYETLHAFIDIAYSRMNHVELFDRLLAGLADDHDVKMLCFLMLAKLISIDREEVLRRVDIIGERFQAILATKLKDNAVKQEVEKLKETVKEVMVITVQLRNEFSELSTSSSGGVSGQGFRSYLEYVKKDFNTQLQIAEAEIRG